MRQKTRIGLVYAAVFAACATAGSFAIGGSPKSFFTTVSLMVEAPHLAERAKNIKEYYRKELGVLEAATRSDPFNSFSARMAIHEKINDAKWAHDIAYRKLEIAICESLYSFLAGIGAVGLTSLFIDRNKVKPNENKAF